MHKKQVFLGFTVLIAIAMVPLLACSSTSAKAANDSSAGKKVFAIYCNSCHPRGGAGLGPNIKAEAADEIKRSVRQGGKTTPTFMPAYGPERINDQQLTALIGYLQSLK